MADLTSRLADRLLSLEWMMATAESCTGGLIAAHCTDLPGSSRWFERGLVTYSNTAKTDLLGVQPDVIAAEGAVSEAVARAMALGAFTGPLPGCRWPSRALLAPMGEAPRTRGHRLAGLVHRWPGSRRTAKLWR